MASVEQLEVWKHQPLSASKHITFAKASKGCEDDEPPFRFVKEEDNKWKVLMRCETTMLILTSDTLHNKLVKADSDDICTFTYACRWAFSSNIEVGNYLPEGETQIGHLMANRR